MAARPDGRVTDVAKAWEVDHHANVTAVLLARAAGSRLTRPGGRVVNISTIAVSQVGTGGKQLGRR